MRKKIPVMWVSWPLDGRYLSLLVTYLGCHRLTIVHPMHVMQSLSQKVSQEVSIQQILSIRLL